MQNCEAQKILWEKLSQLRATNPRFSTRAFAKRAGLSSGALSEILSGKRALSLKVAEKVADRLMFDPYERKQFLGAIANLDTRDNAQITTYTEMALDQFRVLADWIHFGILSLLNTENFTADTQWMARRLKTSPKDIALALARLKRQGLIKETPSGQLKRTTAPIRAGDESADAAIRQSHHQELELARKSLEDDPVGLRDFSSITMAVNPDKLPQAREMIRKFQDDLCSVLERKPRREVYKLCIQLFPVTHVEGDENET